MKASFRGFDALVRLFLSHHHIDVTIKNKVRNIFDSFGVDIFIFSG
jgi:hypothetical protein